MKKQRIRLNTWQPVLAPAMITGAPAPLPATGRLLSDSSSGEKRTVRARRRRRTTSDGGRERAEAPKRRRTSQRPSTPPPISGQRPPRRRPRPGGGSPLPGGRSPLLLIGAVVLLAICVIPIMLLMGGSGDDEGLVYVNTIPTDPPVERRATSTPARTPKPFVPPESTSGEGQTWLVMLYQDADDKILEKDIYVDLNEAERIGSTDRVYVVAQVDRYQAGYRGDGDWSETRRYYVTQDGDLQRVYSQQAASPGEVNMSDGETLVDFVTWAADTFPADKHVLIMSDHGMGWPGGWSDPDPGGRGDPSIPLAAAVGDELFLHELDDALAEIRARTGIEQFELIGLDACLMGHLEVFVALAPHARYAVASQETEPALGWAYTGFLEDLAHNPDMGGAELGRAIVDSYIQEDQRIVDDEARADFLGRGSPLGGLFGGPGAMSASQLARQMEQNTTLTAIDLAAMPELVGSVNELAYALQGARQQDVARARTYAQSFTSVFGKKVPPSYIDLGNFSQLVQRQIGDSNVDQAADRVLASLQRAVIAERHGSKKPGASGVSIYFPNSQLYGSPVTGPQSYTAIARRFADVSTWDDFLAYHYTGRPFEPQAAELVLPERGAQIQAPGAGRIDVSPLELSSDTAAPGRPVLLSADLQGENIGYIYLFAGLYDPDSNSIWVADRDYLESAGSREIDGVYYPDWGEGAFTLEFEWEPLVFAIDDGLDRVVALFTPETYGASFEDATYTVDGTYTYADGGEQRHARLYFSDGLLRQVFGFTGQNGTGSPREIIPEVGDTFTVLDTWLDLDANGRVSQTATQPGGTLTFGDQTFTWRDLDAPPGTYVVGFVIEDLDGNAYEVFDTVRVE